MYGVICHSFQSCSWHHSDLTPCEVTSCVVPSTFFALSENVKFKVDACALSFAAD
jgi:hypothetical protein